MAAKHYSPPVSRLLTYGAVGDFKADTWPDYSNEFGLTADHVPELIRLLTDGELWEASADSPEVWSTTHAWRALGQLRAVEALPPLLELLAAYEDDDYFCDEVSEVLALMGPDILPDLQPYLARADLSEWSKIPVVEGIKLIGQQYHDAQPACVDLLWRQLEGYRDNGDGLNGWLVEGLVKFQVVEAAPLIEAVYAEGIIDEMCAGTWAKVQVDLGLKQESDFEPEDFIPEFVRQLRAQLPDDPNVLAEQLARQLYGISNQGKVSAIESGLPLDLEAIAPEAPPKFGQGPLRTPRSSSARQVQGFGPGKSAGTSSARKSHKNKKKKKK